MGVGGRLGALLATFVARRGDRRDAPLDALKGLAIVGMVLVNHAPPTDAIYAPFVHAPWNGWTLADTIFPAFMFAVGVSIVLALSDAHGEPVDASPQLYGRIARRAALLLAISIVLINFPYYEWHKLKVWYVLSQIGACYFIAALLFLHTRWPAQAGVLLVIWLATWALLALFPVPDVGRGVITPEGNAAAYLHAKLFGGSAAQAYGEAGSEALVGLLGGLASTLLGVLAGQWMRSSRSPATRVAGLAGAGVFLLALGQAWGAVLPINKLLWTSSFAAFMGGISLLSLAALYWLIELHGWRRWAVPLQVAGVNALFLYVFAQSLQRVLVFGRIHGEDGSSIRLRQLIYERVFQPLDPGRFGALLYTLCFFAVCYAVLIVLYRRRIVFKL